MPLRALTTTLVQRGVMIQRALSEFGSGTLTLLVPDQPRWTAAAPWNIPRFACPHRPLAEAGFFENRLVEFVPVPFSAPTDFNDTATDDVWLRAFLVPPAQAVFELARRVGLVRFGAGRKIAVGKISETLSETLPWLAARGAAFGKFQLPTYKGPEAPAFGEGYRPDSWLEEQAGTFLHDRISRLGVFSGQSARAVAKIILEHLSAGLSGLAASGQAIDAAVRRTFEGAPTHRFLLTSGVYGPVGRMLHTSCRNHGVTLIDFEHGATTGLAHTTERRLQVSEATTCDMLFASSDRAASSFRRAPTSDCDIRVIGLADQTRSVHWRPLQRARARRRLKLNGRGPIVMHISGLLYGGNMRSGDDNSVESYVFSTERRLLCDVYGAVNKTVLYKAYPTQRFPHDASYPDLFNLPQNVRIIDRADFRYIRAAADIIVTNANQSTLGWCIGADVPLIRLTSRIVQDLVDDDLNAQMADAFFTVDMDKADWRDRLVELLNQDFCDLRRAWMAKSEARTEFLPGSLFGPSGSVGRRAARMISDLNA
jgi:hypothetical protein